MTETKIIIEDRDTIVIEPRTVSNGGRVINVGLRNITPDLLERLYVQGYLRAFWEPRSAEDRRVGNGRAFQELYMQAFPARGEQRGEYRQMVTLEGHIGSERDIAETVYSNALRSMGRLGAIARSVCIEGWALGLKDSDLRKALDALPAAIEKADNDVRDALDRGR